jgi:hypothetical protein
VTQVVGHVTQVVDHVTQVIGHVTQVVGHVTQAHLSGTGVNPVRLPMLTILPLPWAAIMGTTACTARCKHGTNMPVTTPRLQRTYHLQAPTAY